VETPFAAETKHRRAKRNSLARENAAPDVLIFIQQSVAPHRT
jgi:hypothetical protein